MAAQKNNSGNNSGLGLWSPHESVVIRRVVEMFTSRGIDRMSMVKDQLIAAVKGSLYKHGAPKVSTGKYEPWNQRDFSLIKLYLESLPPSQWTVDDYMLCVDYMVHLYLSPEDLAAEGEWLSVRSSIMGRVQAKVNKEPTVKQVDSMLSDMPSTVTQTFETFDYNDAEKAMLVFGKARAVENVVNVSEKVRHSMKVTVLSYLNDKLAGANVRSLESALSDKLAVLNRDWRMIAITEAGECMNQGLVAGVGAGGRLRRVEMYNGACSFCSMINGKVVTVVDPRTKYKDPDTMIWPGKNNIGRSGSPNKIVAGGMVKRTKDELWTIPAGLVHPNCRGRWLVMPGPKKGDDPVFAAWLEKHFNGGKK